MTSDPQMTPDHQSTDPFRLTRAADWQSDRNPYSPMSGTSRDYPGRGEPCS